MTISRKKTNLLKRRNKRRRIELRGFLERIPKIAMIAMKVMEMKEIAKTRKLRKVLNRLLKKRKSLKNRLLGIW